MAQDPHLKQPGGLILSLVMPSLSPWRLAHPGLLKGLRYIHICSPCPLEHVREPSVLCRVRTYYGLNPYLHGCLGAAPGKILKPNKMLVLSNGSLKVYGIRQMLSALSGTEAEGLWAEY